MGLHPQLETYLSLGSGFSEGVHFLLIMNLKL